MRHVLVGKQGQMSRALANHFELDGSVWFSIDRWGNRPYLNLEECESIDRFFDMLGEIEEPITIWLTAGNSELAFCEANPEVSVKVNRDGPVRIFEKAAARGYGVVFFSTECVFNGEVGDYSEDDLPEPISVYGKHKLEAEKVLLGLPGQHLIIRLPWVFSWDVFGANIAVQTYKWITDPRKLPLLVPTDVVSTPIWAPIAAEASKWIFDYGNTGVWNVAGRQSLSEWKLVANFINIFDDQDLYKGFTRITPCLLKDCGPAMRPKKAGLSVEKLLKSGFRIPPLVDQIKNIRNPNANSLRINI